MILWTSKEEPETRERMPCTAFRWTFQVCSNEIPGDVGFNIGFIHQHKSEGLWRNGHDAYLVSMSSEFNIGARHFYYDCPHCTYSFGPFTYYRGANWDCKKCMEGM